MRRVEQCVIRPNHCAAIPHLGSAHAEGYFDTGTDLQGFDNRVYVSVVAVKEMARELGWIPPGEQTTYDEVLAVKDREIARLTEELEDERRVTNAIDVLESKDFRARRKRGPQPKVKEAV